MEYWATEYTKLAVDLTALRRMTRSVNPAGAFPGSRVLKFKPGGGTGSEALDAIGKHSGGFGMFAKPAKTPTQTLLERIRTTRPDVTAGSIDGMKNMLRPVGATVLPKGGFVGALNRHGLPVPDHVSSEHKEFVNRLARAHETHLEASRAANVENLFFGHASPGVTLAESNMVANAPDHLREGVRQHFRPFRMGEQSAIRTMLPDFEYGKTVVPRAMRDHIERTLTLTPKQQTAHTIAGHAALRAEATAPTISERADRLFAKARQKATVGSGNQIPSVPLGNLNQKPQ